MNKNLLLLFCFYLHITFAKAQISDSLEIPMITHDMQLCIDAMLPMATEFIKEHNFFPPFAGGVKQEQDIDIIFLPYEDIALNIDSNINKITQKLLENNEYNTSILIYQENIKLYDSDKYVQMIAILAEDKKYKRASLIHIPYTILANNEVLLDEEFATWTDKRIYIK